MSCKIPHCHVFTNIKILKLSLAFSFSDEPFMNVEIFQSNFRHSLPVSHGVNDSFFKRGWIMDN